MNKSDSFTRFTREIRASFQALSSLGSALHADLGVTASMRAVMEFIDDTGPTPAAEMARKKNVSRQHIQTIADQLIDAGLAETRENPAHKRSVLIVLTVRGRAVYQKMKTREDKALAAIAAPLTAADMRTATQTLEKLRHAVSSQQEKETKP